MSAPLSAFAFLAIYLPAIAADSSSLRGGTGFGLPSEANNDFNLEQALLEESASPHRALTYFDDCVEELSAVDFFEISISLDTQTPPADCQKADKIMLGHDINRLMYENGVGEDPEGHESKFTGSVCTTPETATRRMLGSGIYQKAVNFNYGGLGGCAKFCNPDNKDGRFLMSGVENTEDAFQRRELTSAWFGDTYKPFIEAKIHDALVNEVVPAHERCLGTNPTISVEVSGTTKKEATIPCSNHNGDFALLDTVNLADIMLNSEQASCSLCKHIDFSTKKEGDWIRYDYLDDGVEITVYPGDNLEDGGTGGYAPNNQAHIFNTSNPVGDPDLGSPNALCPGGGPGYGIGGAPGMQGENCYPIGSKYNLWRPLCLLACWLTSRLTNPRLLLLLITIRCVDYSRKR